MHPKGISVRFLNASLVSGILLLAATFYLPVAVAEPYKVIRSAKVGGDGGFDYVFADAEQRRLYIPRPGGATSHVTVYDLDTLESVGEIPDTISVHGVAVDPKSNHGFSSSKPVVMFDTKTLKTIKTINVDGNPDGILFDPATERSLRAKSPCTERDRN